jgi:hypothetical protein
MFTLIDSLKELSRALLVKNCSFLSQRHNSKAAHNLYVPAVPGFTGFAYIMK